MSLSPVLMYLSPIGLIAVYSISDFFDFFPMIKENLSWFDSNDARLMAFFADVRAKLAKHFPGKSFAKDREDMLLSDAEIAQLAKEGNYDKIVECNLRLVISIAHQYTYLGPSLLDVIEEGCKGLIEAAHTYRLEDGKFDKKACRMIKEAIWSAYDEYRELPSDFSNLVRKVKEAQKALYNEFLTDVNDPELILEYLEDKYADKPSVCRCLSYENVQRALNYGATVRLDAVNEEDDDNGCIADYVSNRDMFGDECGDNADSYTEKSDKCRVANFYLGLLNDRDREIAKLHFGMVDNFAWGVEMIASKMGISTTRVNQVLLDLESLKDKGPKYLRQAC